MLLAYRGFILNNSEEFRIFFSYLNNALKVSPCRISPVL